ncbi:RNA polymerase sigma factor [Dyadobacter sp. LHD-138]|uniref:RNA polymerase sigma factor n=1 Tax=Dyadobacter sp. LHD-138 TaxID=3071413 RepID=UPI0027DFA4B1|nr:RNA polymerase sigma factor [Dyadobacter sp. LHD-138]MDQ6480535.1 RNA polymerase sigma factor [Dyadobacter sp. LHD-138]
MKLFRSKSKLGLSELVQACQKQDSRAQVLFYDRYKAKLMGVCIRYARTVSEAEDIFQEGMLKIFQKITELKNPQSADSWVKTIMIRYAVDYYNQVTRKENLQGPYEDIPLELGTNDPEDLLNKFEVTVLLETINELPDGYRLVINLYFVDGYTHAEIAGILGIVEGTSRSQLLRGRNLLLKKLEQKGIKQYETF